MSDSPSRIGTQANGNPPSSQQPSNQRASNQRASNQPAGNKQAAGYENKPVGSETSSRLMLIRISVMMFLEYWPLGLWGITIGTYLSANTGSLGLGIYEPGFVGYSAATAAIGSILSPILIGIITDRFFSAEKVVSLLHVGAALAAWWLFVCLTQAGFFWGMLFYFQCFVPTVILTNAIALRHLKNVDKEFSVVRIYGTVGWIAAGTFIGFFWPYFVGESIEATRIPLGLSAISHIVMAFYALTLPKTPPMPNSEANQINRNRTDNGLEKPLASDHSILEKNSWFRQITHSTIWRNRPFLFFLLFSLLACLPSMAYTTFANPFLNDFGFESAAGILTLGQYSEVACLFVMSLLVGKLGLKRLMLVGLLAWGIRYLLLTMGVAYESNVSIYLAILIHGPCYVFIYVAGQLYIDQLASKENRGAAQGLLALATTGLGHLIGSLLSGVLQEQYLSPERVGGPSWEYFWLIPACLCFATALLFQLAFREPEGHGPKGKIELHGDELPPSPRDALAESPHR